jgi:hypothetical protein
LEGGFSVLRTERLGQFILCVSLVCGNTGCVDLPGKGDVSAPGINEFLGRDPGRSLAGGLGVAPITIDMERLNLEFEGIKPEQIVDTELFQQEVVDWAQKTKLFQQCNLLKREEEDQSFDDIAWATGSDVILETTIVGIKPRFKGHHWSWIPNWVNLVMLTIPAWWVATENYELEVNVELKLRLLDQPQAQLITTTKAVVEGRFDEWERGFRWLGLGMVFSPGMNTGENWTQIGKKLFEACASKLSQEMVKTIDEEFREVTAKKEYGKAKKRTLAIVVGIGTYKDRNNFQPNPEASKGARQVAKELTNKYGSRYVKTLIDSQATKKRLEKTIADFFGKKARAGDNLVLYISARTTMLGGTPVVVMYDSTPERGVLPMGSLSNKLAQAPGNKAFLLETDYPEKYGRKPLETLFKPLFSKKITVMSATKPGRLQVPTGFGMGLFSYHVSQGLKGKGDLNKDGQITFAEVGVYIDDKVRSDSGMRGPVQEPFVAIKN